jgi:hypothetical protein
VRLRIARRWEARLALLIVLAACAMPPDRGRRIETAIERAEQYLQGRGARLDPLMTYVLVRLERRYGLGWTAAQRAAVLAAAPSSAQLRLFGRLVDPRARPDPDLLATVTNTSDRLILSGLYCKELGAPSRAALEAFAGRPGADVAHGALAMQWARENGCLDDAAAAPLRRLFIDALIAQAAANPAADVGIESMAMLDYIGAAERIQPVWVDAILGAQHPDGGWGEHPGDPSNDHTTTLALWVLLASSGRPAADVPWIPAR